MHRMFLSRTDKDRTLQNVGCQLLLCNKDIAHSMGRYTAKENLSLVHITNLLAPELFF